MAKIQFEARIDAQAGRTEAPPMSGSVRRHIGKSLRSHYAAALTEPVSERLEALLAKLDRPKV